jgi:hypothetical protein
VTKVHIQSSHQFIHIQAIPILTLVNAKQNINSTPMFLREKYRIYHPYHLKARLAPMLLKNHQVSQKSSCVIVVTESKEIGITHSAVDSFVSSFSITHRNCFSAKPDGSLKALERVSLLNDRDDICDTFPSET